MSISSHDYSLMLLDKCPALIWRSGLDAKCDYFNETWLTFTGRRLKEELRDGWTNGVHPEDLDCCITTYLRAFEKRQGFEMEYRLRRHDGEYRWIVNVGHPLNDLDGEFVGYIGSCYCITARKEAEEALRISEQAIRELYDITSVPNRSFDDRIRSLLNLGCRRFALPHGMLTRQVDDSLELSVLQSPDTGFVEGTLLPQCQTFCAETLKSDIPLSFEHAGQSEWRHHPAYFALGLEAYLATKVVVGQTVYGTLCFASSSPYSKEFTDADKDFLQIMARWIGGELERQKAENNLRATEKLYRQILDSTLDMVFVKDQHCRFLWGNKAFRTYHNLSNEELRGILDSPINEPGFSKQSHEDDSNVLTTGKVLDIPEEPVTRHDEQVHLFHTIKTPLFGENGEVEKLVGVARDITERKQTEKRLRESEAKRTEALSQSDELKSALLSSVSHELRTPLTAMKASISSIMNDVPAGGMNALQQEFLKGVDKEINYMSRLVDNLLDMSQIEAGTLKPQREWHPLEDLVEGALRRIDLTSETQRVNVRIPENIPPIFVDAVGIQQVLINVLDNAIKYSAPESLISIYGHLEVQQVEVSVSNKGESIQAQDLERIFERFYRQQLPRQQPIRGTGLGLSICRGIIEAHGGRIWAESFDGEVRIIFTVPITESMTSFSLEGLGKAKGK